MDKEEKDCDDGDCGKDGYSDGNDDAFAVLHYCSTGKSIVTAITVTVFVAITVVAIIVINSNTSICFAGLAILYPINSICR